MLSNRNLLNLEGPNNIYGWHAYLWYEKNKIGGFFTHHYIRRNIFNVWFKYKKYTAEMKPLWIVPAEVIKPYSEHHGEDWLTYRNLLLITDEKTKLKLEELPHKYGLL